MKLQRLSTMRPAELVFRTRQELTKRLERVGVIGHLESPPGFVLNELVRHNGHEHAPDANFDELREAQLREAGEALFQRSCLSASARFFKGAASTRTRALLDNRMPGVREQMIALADDVSRGHFCLLGYPRLFFGDPIDWHLDAVSGRRAPRMHWSRINPLDAQAVGDSKVIWELNRHQWLVSLGQAYRLTGEERYADVFAARIRAWMQANPVGLGINWASSLEVALRLISWSWALTLFRGSQALTAALYVEMLEWMRAHASHVERYLSNYFSPNTHLTGEALGLFCAGVVFPELDGADRWHARGMRILLEQLERQVFADGVYFEQSTCYQRYSVEIYLCFLILAQRNDITLPASVSERVQRMLDFLLTISRADGTVPQIGDADGGALLPLVRRAPGDCRGVLATAAALFGRADYAWAAGGVTPEVLWLLGPEGCAAYDALSPAPPATTPTRLFAEGGYVVMRSGWEPGAHQLIFDTGPLGDDVSGGHGHADLLSIQCAVFGQPCLIDPGTYGYTTDARWRDYFRSSAAHNTIMVDGLSQATPAGPFQWQQRPRARLRRWLSTDDFDLADADHDAYQRLADPVTHRRRVLFSKPRYWMVIDELQAQETHRIDLCFQFAASTQLILGADAWAIARQADGCECRLLVFATAPLQLQQVDGRMNPIQGWESADYGRRQPASALRYSSETRLPLRIVTLLCPAQGESSVPPVVASSMQHTRIDLIFEDVIETVHLGERDIVVERQ